MLIGKGTINSPSTTNRHDCRCHIPARPRPSGQSMYKRNSSLHHRSFPCQHQPQLSVRNQQDWSSHSSHHAITSLVLTTSCLGKAPPLCTPSSHIAHSITTCVPSICLQGPPSLCRPYERTCWHHTQPHAAPLRSKGLHHYTGRIRAFAGVTQPHAAPLCS